MEYALLTMHFACLQGLKRLLKIARPEAALLGGAFAALVFSSASSLALPKVDHVLPWLFFEWPFFLV